MGTQNFNYDFLNMQDKKAVTKPTVNFKKINGISEYHQDTHVTEFKPNRDYQQAFKQDTTIFRKS